MRSGDERGKQGKRWEMGRGKGNGLGEGLGKEVCERAGGEMNGRFQTSGGKEQPHN